MEWIIRLADQKDAGELARLRFEFRASMNEAAEPEEEFVARCEEWMAARLGGGTAWRCWVAEGRGVGLAGHLWLQLVEKIPNPVPELEWHGYITNVYVREEARGGGLGGRLVEAAMAHCREAGVDSVVLWPTERSRGLYGRHGFGEPEDMLEAIIDPGRQLH